MTPKLADSLNLVVTIPRGLIGFGGLVCTIQPNQPTH